MYIIGKSIQLSPNRNPKYFDGGCDESLNHLHHHTYSYATVILPYVTTLWSGEARRCDMTSLHQSIVVWKCSTLHEHYELYGKNITNDR